MTSHDSRYFRLASILLGLTALLFIGPVHALGLGKLTVLSALDEPLVAEIELTSVEDGALDSLELKLGSAEDFEQASVLRDTFLKTFEFTVVKGGVPKVRINTTFPAKEPFLHFLIRASWNDGNLLREYTALLDPPLYAEKQPTAISSPGVLQEVEQLSSADSGVSPADETAAESVATESAASGQPATGAFTGAEFGPTEAGDTLWNIASRFDAGDGDINVYQIMIALLRENPEAFIDNNINRLKKGQILRLTNPDVVGKDEASQAYQTQLEEWESFRIAAAGSTDVVKVPSDESPAAVGTEPSSSSAESPAEESAAAGQDLLKIVQASLEEEGGGTGTESAQANTAAQAEKEIGMLQEKISTLEESLVSAELQNKELQERVTMLEEQVVNAQRLVELESQELALAQDQAARQQEEKQLLEQQIAEQQLQAEQAELQAEQAKLQAEQAELEAEQARLEAQTAELEAQARLEAQTAELEAQARLEAQTTELEESAEPGEADETMSEQPEAADAGLAEPEAMATVPQAPAAEVDMPADQAEAESVVEEQPAAQLDETRIDSSQDTAAATVPMPAQPQPKAWWESTVDYIMGSSMSVIAAGAGALLLLAGGIMFARRRRSLAEFEESILSGSGLEGQSDTTDRAANKNTDTSFLSDFGMAGMGSMQADEVDPLAEAEVYMAYGRDEQAEEVLKEAATRSPQRHELKLKLLEIYQQREDIKSFETLAEELYPAGGQGDPETWSKVVKMGAKMNPNNPLFSQHVEDTQPSTVDPGGLLDAAVELELPERAASQMNETDLPDEIISQASGPVDPAMHPFPPPDESVDIDEEFDRIKEQIDMPNLSETEPVVEDSAGLSEDDAEMLDFASNERSDLEFDIDLSDADKPEKDELTNEELLKTAQEEEAKTRSTNDDFASEVNEIDIADLDLAEIDEPTLQTNALSSDSDMESIDMPDVGSDNLPTGESGSREPAEESAREVSRNFGVVTGGANAVDESEAGSEKWDEAATKLDLAQAYLNMGDKAGARSIIDEVMKEGSPAQKDQAAVLQARIG